MEKDNNQPAEFPQPPTGEQVPKKEKLEFLKRAEIRTMQKDLSHLREEEARKEREKIIKIKEEKERQKERKLVEKIRRAAEKRRGIETKIIQQIKAEESFQKTKEEKSSLEQRINEFIQVRKKAQEELAEILEKEKIIEEKLEVIRKIEKETKILTEQRRTEQERWQLETERQRIESEKWPKQDELKNLANQIEEVNLRYQQILETEKKLAKELKTKKKERPILKPQPEKKVAPKIRPEKKPPTHFEKIFVRVALAILIFLILVLVFALVYDWQKLLPEEEPIIEEVTEETVKEKAEESLPSALIPFRNTKIIEVSSWDNLPQTISDLVTAPLGENEFIRIVIKNTAENKFLTLEEFLKAFEVKTPENFYSKLTGRFDLYVFAKKEVNRVGFAVEIKNKEGLSGLLKSWEKTMESDFENLSTVEGKKFPASDPNFKEKNYKGNIFSYITFSPLPDYFGICYGIADDYLIITSSCHNTLDLLDLLSSEHEEQND